MELYLIRHGIAHDPGPKNDFIDEKRALTSEGRQRIAEEARGLTKLGVQPDLILASPLVRAAETAAIVAEGLEIPPDRIVTNGNLVPGGRLDDLFLDLKDLNKYQSLALVGHEPHLGMLLYRLICGYGGGSIPMKKGGVCRLDLVETALAFRGSLAWFLSPKQARLLGKA